MAASNEVIDDLFGTGPLPKLYAKGPIIWYSFLFSPFVGGVLLTINLWRLKKKGIALTVLFGALIYSLGVGYVGFMISYPASSRLIVLILNLVGGNILSSPIWRQTIGALPFQKANAWIPLIVVLIVSAALWALVFFGLSYYVNY